MIEKDLIVGVIKSALHKAAKLVEQGKLLTGQQFEAMLQEQSKYEHLYFWVNSVTLSSGRDVLGTPHIEIVCEAEGYVFKSSFTLLEPSYKHSDKTPFAQHFMVEEIQQS